MKKTFALLFLVLGLCLSIGFVSCELLQYPTGGGRSAPSPDGDNLPGLDYCTSNAECDDDDVCTHDICSINLNCRNPRIEDCC